VCGLDVLVRDAEAQQQVITLFIEGLDTGVQPSGIGSVPARTSASKLPIEVIREAARVDAVRRRRNRPHLWSGFCISGRDQQGQLPSLTTIQHN
jgi:hypothetical protein